jgi:hypothetical protein
MIIISVSVAIAMVVMMMVNLSHPLRQQVVAVNGKDT